MKYNVVAPSVGESITEVSILKWHKQTGEAVKNGDLLLEIESDKATVEVVAEAAGVLTTLKPAGERIPVGEQIGIIDSEGKATSTSPTATPSGPTLSASPQVSQVAQKNTDSPQSPAVRKALTETGLNPATISGTGKDGRLTKGDVLAASSSTASPTPTHSAPPAPKAVQGAQAPLALREGDRRVPMSMLRAKIAERLVHAQHTAAILTTFNEVDMTEVMKLRNANKDAFKAKHGAPLSFMSFFTRGVIEALKIVPEINASIDSSGGSKDMIYHDYHDIGIAVGSERGLVVPVIRNAGTMGFVEIEKNLAELALKARNGKLSIADLSGGTFTISNGGTYGSLLSTPILNPPQSGILGMHKIQERPVAIDGQVVIRPMMYLALSYDHRIIDGKGAVTFLVQLKDFLEHPEKLKFEY